MTVTIKTPELVSSQTFDRLVDYAVDQRHLTRAYAERGVLQMLIALKACADNPGVAMVMDASLDPFWHDFQLHGREYQQFEADHAGGRRLWHDPSDLRNEAELVADLHRTLELVNATGLPVDMEFWSGRPSPCVQGGSPQ